jgi:hypothetical protein
MFRCDNVLRLPDTGNGSRQIATRSRLCLSSDGYMAMLGIDGITIVDALEALMSLPAMADPCYASASCRSDVEGDVSLALHCRASLRILSLACRIL